MTPIEKAIRSHDNGIICPAEVWTRIASATTADTVFPTLDALPDDVKRQLLECFKQRPFSLMYPARDSGVHDEMERWCLERLRRSARP